MNKNNPQITADDARAAMASIEAAEKITANSMRPPLWLILLCSMSLGIKTTAMGLMINNNLWHSIQWMSFIVIMFSVISWIVALRIKGITIKITDVQITKQGVISGILICILLVSSRAVYLQTANILFPYIAGILNTLVLAYGLRFNLRLNAKAKV